jgi:hypothetical protein
MRKRAFQMQLPMYPPAILAMVVSVTMLCPDSVGSERVIVQAKDGRVLTGEVDRRTDERLLWVRVTSPSLALSTSVPWNQVAWAQRGERQYESREFRSIAAQLATALPKEFFKTPEQYTHPDPVDNDGSRNGRLYVVPPTRPQAPVTTLTLRASVANWDGDAENDGIEITIAPLSTTGTVSPLDGQMVVKLAGRRYRSTRRLPPTVPLEKWSVRVRPEDFATWGATYRLPFRAFLPEKDRTIAVEGQLDVQLSGGRAGTLKARVPVHLR